MDSGGLIGACCECKIDMLGPQVSGWVPACCCGARAVESRAAGGDGSGRRQQRAVAAGERRRRGGDCHKGRACWRQVHARLHAASCPLLVPALRVWMCACARVLLLSCAGAGVSGAGAGASAGACAVVCGLGTAGVWVCVGAC